MPEASGDPRVYFAAERTLLAWIRTGIGVMAFGFVVARFGLFLRLVSASDGTLPRSSASPYVGVILVFLGAVATAAGTLQYRRYCRGLPAEDLPSGKVPILPVLLAWSLVVLGLVLTSVLLS